ncbi:hypothetical protein RHMOL_Rhmol06G0040400 [Rhododendron molle]|uniref:Uncharacterized protein n=1 Tax=Rhododendron molle TaxID=49168 RepID=A0ACC0N8L2_RHOML|nr:hypothetical protein RHMOL_Rhmol06G0040400 [Rhododendron molle]
MFGIPHLKFLRGSTMVGTRPLAGTQFKMIPAGISFCTGTLVGTCSELRPDHILADHRQHCACLSSKENSADFGVGQFPIKVVNDLIACAGEISFQSKSLGWANRFSADITERKMEIKHLCSVPERRRFPGSSKSNKFHEGSTRT